MKRFLSLILLFASLVIVTKAQTPRLYGISQGLASSCIDHISFDNDNFLWITSEAGLTRFDGQTFTTYTSNKGSQNALNDNRVNTLFESSDNLHWVGGSDGLYYLCRTENRFSRYVVNSERPNISVSSIVEHPLLNHTLIVGTSGYGTYFFDTETRTFNPELSTQLSVQMKRWNATILHVDHSTHLWVAHPQGIDCIDLEHIEAIPLSGDASILENTSTQAMAEDTANRRLYFGTVNQGLLCCNIEDLSVAKIDIPELNGRNITSLCIAPDGALVIGTENQGLFVLKDEKLLHVSVFDCPVDLDHVKIHSIAFDDQENLWLGLYQKGLLVLPKQAAIFRSIPVCEKGSAYNLGNVSAFASMPDGSRLYGLDGTGLLHRYQNGEAKRFSTENTIMATDAVLSLAVLPDNRAYVGTYNYGLYLYDGKTIRREKELAQLDNQSIMQVAYDSLYNKLYIGTNGDGVYIFDTKTRKLDRISGDHNLLWTTSLCVDSQHFLWLCMSGDLHKYSPVTNTYVNIKYAQTVRVHGYAEEATGTMWMASDRGLLYCPVNSDSLILATDANGRPLNNKYVSLLQSDDHRLWVASNTRLLSYDMETWGVTVYDDPAIAETGAYSPRAAIAWPDHTLAFGGDNGMLLFSPEAVRAYSRTVRPIFFTRLRVNNQITDYDPNLSADENVLNESLWKASKLHLPAASNSFSLSFAVQEYCDPVGIVYHYKLEGHDKDWHENHDSSPTASYTSLPWGNYTLRVKASMSEGNGNVITTEKSMQIEIDAPWWATWWAWLIYALLVIGATALSVSYIRHRTHQKRVLVRAQQNRQIKDAKLKMFASISHEIKTPLTLLISPLRKLMERNNDNATQSIYEMMYRNTLRILMLVNQQMDIRKLDKGQMKLHVEAISLRAFIDELKQYFSNTILSRQIDFRFIMSDNASDMTIWADPQQIDKVFFNLLSNAFKFVNDNGVIEIIATTQPEDGDCHIRIFNTGSQLPDTEKEWIFNRFIGYDGTTEIGLNLAHELTLLHHGTLKACNEENGVAFSLTLPMHSDAFSAEELKPEVKPDPFGKTIERDYSPEIQASPNTHQVEDAADKTDQSKQLMDLLSDELKEKKRLRERRSNLGFDYTKQQVSSADEKLLQRVVDCIHKNLGDSDFSVDVMAQEIGISRVHLNRKLKELLDTSPSTLIKTTRLKQAAFLLVQSNVTVAEVAYSVGFSSPAYFTSNFSGYFGMTPKEFINTYAENPNSESLKKLLE